MRRFIQHLAVAFICLLVGFSPVNAKKSSKASGFGGMTASPNLTITLSPGGSTGSRAKSKKTRKSGKRSSRRRKTKLPVI